MIIFVSDMGFNWLYLFNVDILGIGVILVIGIFCCLIELLKIFVIIGVE